MSALINLKGEELAKSLCAAFETPPVITAHAARKQDPDFEWYSDIRYWSPRRWWVANIGTDHGPESEDHSPVRWRPLPELTEQIEPAWAVVDEMKRRGWLFHVMAIVDGWVVNAWRYDIAYGCDQAVNTTDFVQELGDTAEEAICRAALAALQTVQA